MKILHPTSFRWLLIIGLLFLAFGCKRCGKSVDVNENVTDGHKEIKVMNCETYNKTETSCNAAIQSDGKHCNYDKESGNCTAAEGKKEHKPCRAMSKEECAASNYCTFSYSLNVCQETAPPLKGKCAAIQVENACNADPECHWNQATDACEVR